MVQWTCRRPPADADAGQQRNQRSDDQTAARPEFASGPPYIDDRRLEIPEPPPSVTREPSARGEEFPSLPRRARWPQRRRRELAGLALEPALAPGWGLSWLVRCVGRPDCEGGVNLTSPATNSWPLTSPGDSEELTGQKPHCPGSRSCLQRSALPLAALGASDRLIAAASVFGCITSTS